MKIQRKKEQRIFWEKYWFKIPSIYLHFLHKMVLYVKRKVTDVIKWNSKDKENTIFESVDKINIAVTGIGQGVGTTFVSSSLAFYFSEKGKEITFIECAAPDRCNRLLYEEAAMDKRIGGRGFTDFYRIIKDSKPLKGMKNIYRGINWILITPEICEKKTHLTLQEVSRLINIGKSEINIIDLELAEEWECFLLDMDCIIAVLDPSPGVMIRNKETYKRVKKAEINGQRVIWIVNKYNKGVSKHQVVQYIKSKNIFWLDEIQTTITYAAQFGCKFYWEVDFIRTALDSIFTKISHKMEELL